MKNSKKIGNWKLEIGNSKRSLAGFSLIEMLVVISIFSVLGVVLTQALANSLRGSKKSESIGLVRGNLEYSVSTMERLLRNASDIRDTSTATRLEYVDEYGHNAYFECNPGNYIASGSATVVRLTTNEVRVDCSGTVFNYVPPPPGSNAPKSVSIVVRGQDAALGTGVEGSSVTVRTKVLLRNYSFD